MCNDIALDVQTLHWMCKDIALDVHMQDVKISPLQIDVIYVLWYVVYND